MKVQIKPLTTNQAYMGRRFKTKKLKDYQEELGYILPKYKVPEGKLQIRYLFGLSNKNADYDNCIKAFQDCLQEKYGFNDNKIYRALVEKVDVKKGEEFIEFEIKEYES